MLNGGLSALQTAVSARYKWLVLGCGSGMSYQPRIVDAELSEVLSYAGVVLLEGPKACGQTETARQHCASEALLDVDPNLQTALQVDPSLVLEGPTPRLIDEWQVEPKIWNHVRRAVDDRGGKPGGFILTGSAVPVDDATRHTGAGRISRIRMRPMSLFELGHSNGEISLAALVGGEPARAQEPGLGIADIADMIATGGWHTARPGAGGAPHPGACSQYDDNGVGPNTCSRRGRRRRTIGS